MKKESFQLTGISCGACVQLISKRIKKIEGVYTVTVNKDGRTEVISQCGIGRNYLIQALSDTDYEVN